MSIKRIGENKVLGVPTSDDDNDSKPLVREFGKTNPHIYTEAHQVISGSISKSGLWCMIHTEHYVLLCKTSSTAVKELFNDILPNVNGKRANALVVEPVKKNKFGGCIGVDDEIKAWYSYDPETLSFEITDEEPAKEKKQTSLSLDMFLDAKESLALEQKTIGGDSTGEKNLTNTKTKTTRKRTQDTDIASSDTQDLTNLSTKTP